MGSVGHIPYQRGSLVFRRVRVQGGDERGDSCHSIFANVVYGRVCAATDHVELAVRFRAERTWERFGVGGGVALDRLCAVVDPVINEARDLGAFRVGKMCAVVPRSSIKQGEVGPFQGSRSRSGRSGKVSPAKVRLVFGKGD